jgi:hypothetical protein
MLLGVIVGVLCIALPVKRLPHFNIDDVFVGYVTVPFDKASSSVPQPINYMNTPPTLVQAANSAFTQLPTVQKKEYEWASGTSSELD